MLTRLDAALGKQGVSKERFYRALDKFGDPEVLTEVLRAQGLPLYEHQGKFIYKTAVQPLAHTKFCVIDIETNGSKPAKGHTVMEVGAVIFQDGQVIDEFESFVQCNKIPENISELTGITLEDTLNAPSLKEVMYALRTFMGQCVFVAHDVRFDYMFVSAMMERAGLEPLANRRLCTFELAQRTIESDRYGLKHLNERFHLHHEAEHHRALSDAITALELFKICLNKLPKKITNAEALIRFSKEANKLTRLPKEKKKNEKEEDTE